MARFFFFFVGTVFFLSFTLPAEQLRGPDIISQVFTPGPQNASSDDAWSLFTNPAGISFVDGTQLVGGYAHLWRNHNSNLHQGQAGVAFNVFDGLAFGFGLHLALPPNANVVDADKGQIDGTLGLAYRFHRAFAIGATTYKQRRYALAESDPFIFNLGVQGYPTSWLALGASASQVFSGFGSPLEFRFGAAFRPFGEPFTLSADIRLWPTENSWQRQFEIDPQIALRLDLGGFSVFGNAIMRNVAQGISAPTLLAGIEFNFAHFGLTALGGGRTPLESAYIGGRFRLSSEKWPSLPRLEGQWLSFTLTKDGKLASRFHSLAERLFNREVSPVLVLERLSQVAKDESVEGIILRLDDLDIGFGRAQEIHNVILALRNSGKKVVVYFDSASAIDYYIASAADRVYLSPGGEIELDRFRNTLVYFKQGLMQLGVDAEAITAGRYKNAVKPFTSTTPSAEELEVTQSILNENYRQLTDALKKRIHQPEKATDYVDLGSVTASEAFEAGLIDGAAYLNNIPELLQSDLRQPVKPEDNYFSIKKKQRQWGNLPRIVVIPISGALVQGRVPPGIFAELFPRIGADDVIDAIAHAEQNPNVVAIILRLETPGGDALASDLIYNAALKARAHKPVLASMGDIAASGGYYIAAGAHEIWAEPSTLTGSIGVFSLHFSGQKLADKLGIASFEVKKGKRPGPSLLRPFTTDEKTRAQNLVDWHYKRFKSAVVFGKNLSEEEVDKAAEGRVWTGQQALDMKLVDQIGGITQVIDRAKAATGLGESDKFELFIAPVSGTPSISVKSLVNSVTNILPFVELGNRPLALMPLSFGDL